MRRVRWSAAMLLFLLCGSMYSVGLAEAHQKNENADENNTIYVAGVAGVKNPKLRPRKKYAPHYPELARAAGLEAKLVLQAIVRRDGTVHDIKVLRCTHAGFGFEAAATRAVRRWRYKPAMKDGKPVDVYFLINVEFNLR